MRLKCNAREGKEILEEIATNYLISWQGTDLGTSYSRRAKISQLRPSFSPNLSVPSPMILEDRDCVK